MSRPVVKLCGDEIRGWFSGGRLTLMNIMMLSYCTVRHISVQTICLELQVNHHTVSEWRQFCHKAMLDFTVVFYEKVGGGLTRLWNSIKAALGGAKYNRSRLRTTMWVLGGVKWDLGRTFLYLSPIIPPTRCWALSRHGSYPALLSLVTAGGPTFVSMMRSSCTTL